MTYSLVARGSHKFPTRLRTICELGSCMSGVPNWVDHSLRNSVANQIANSVDIPDTKTHPHWFLNSVRNCVHRKLLWSNSQHCVVKVEYKIFMGMNFCGVLHCLRWLAVSSDFRLFLYIFFILFLTVANLSVSPWMYCIYNLHYTMLWIAPKRIFYERGSEPSCQLSSAHQIATVIITVITAKYTTSR